MKTLVSGAVVVLVMAIVIAIVGVLWSRGTLNDLVCDGECGPSAVAVPESVQRDAMPETAAASGPSDGRPEPAAIAAAVGDALDSAALGSNVGFATVDPSDGSTLWTSGSGTFVPASNTKLLTGFAALEVLDPQQRFVTRVVASGDDIVLVGGGDPYLVTELPEKPVYAIEADLTTLAERTAAALRRSGRTTVGVDYDASLFTGPAVSPTWEPTYISSDVVTRVSALWTDQGVVQGVGRVDDPAASAAKTFAGLLQEQGIDVTGSVQAQEAPESAPPIAQVRSATVGRIVETMVATSDNQAAEVLLRHIGAAAGEGASFDGGTAAVEKIVQRPGIDTTGLELHDGSGLSRDNRISPVTLADVVAAASRSPRTDGLDAGLAVAGFTGTLKRRFDTDAAEGGRGVVRGKSGTLTGVHSLAGYVTDLNGTPIAFAVMTDRTEDVAGAATEAALDRVAAAIAGCDCSR